MPIQYPQFPFSKILGWSISRYEVFDKCKRQYFYTYYSRYVPDVPQYKLTMLRDLTSVPLEVGNIVHDVLERLLRRLQQSDSRIDEEKFLEYADQKAEEYVSRKTFLEVHYKQYSSIDVNRIKQKVRSSLVNFLESPCFSWLYMKAITNRTDWMIEPAGYGETRLSGIKAYCKMDFLFPVGEEIHILDWKTGARDPVKHTAQLMGYSVAANSNFGIPWNRIFPKIVYLNPVYDELEISFKEQELEEFFQKIRAQTDEMCSFCKDVQENIPLQMDSFTPTPSSLCRNCKYQEICLPKAATPAESF